MRSKLSALLPNSRTGHCRMTLKNIWRLTGALPLLSITALLSGCGTQQTPPRVEYRTISAPRLNLPSSQTSHINVPAVPDGMSYGQSVGLNGVLYGVIGRCNADRAAIRKIEFTR